MSEQPTTRCLAVRLRTWRSRAGLVAVGLIALQAGWRGVLLGRGFFTQDDYLMVRLGRAPMSAHLLFQEYSGHLWPGNFALAWMHARLGPLDWPAFVAEILLMQVAAAALAWLVLSRLIPGSWVRIPLLCVALFCPLTLWPTAWWAAAIGFLPVSIALLLATWALLVHLQDGARWAPYVIGAAMLGGLAFQERALLIPLVLVMVAVACSSAPGWRAVVEAVRSRWPLWTSLAALGLAYLVVHRVLAPVDATSVGTGDGLELFSNFVVRTAVPGLVGGPWNPTVVSNVLLQPSVYAIVVAWLLLATAVVLSVRRSRASGWGWLLLLAYVLADVALLFAGRTALGPALGLSPRYAADIVPVVPIALGLVVRAARAPLTTTRSVEARGGLIRGGLRSRRAGGILVAGATVAYLASAAVTTNAVAHHTENTEDRAFVQTLRSELRADPNVVIYDSTPPDDIMTFWFGSDARVSTLVGLAPEAPLFDVPTDDLRVADASGRLQPVDLVGGAGMVANSNTSCGYAIGSMPTRIPLQEVVEGDRLVVRISYFTSAGGTLRVRAGNDDEVAPLRSSADMLYLVVSGRVDAVTVNLQAEPDDQDVVSGPPGTVCAVGVAVGFPVPRGDPS